MEEVLKELQDNMPQEYESKTPGFLTHDLLKTVAIVIAEKLETKLDEYRLKLDPRNMTLDELKVETETKKGITQKLATFAKVTLTVTGTGTIHKNDLFSTSSNIKFKALADTVINGSIDIEAECEESGIIGNVGANTIVQFPITIQGITKVTNPAAAHDGFDAESRESLLDRYLTELQKPPTSNNIYHFDLWARSVAGVGKAKVFSTWNGNLTVKVAIIDDNMLPASATLVDEVQEYIDPLTEWGKGAGASAVGSHCTVVSATAKNLDITATVTLGANFDKDTVKTNIEKAITEYLKTIAFDEQINYISHARIVSLFFDVEGVLDAKDVSINGNLVDNITLGDEEVGVLGSVTI